MNARIGIALLLVVGATPTTFAERATPVAKPAPTAVVAESAAQKTAKLVAAAKAQVGVTRGYDPAYVKLAFPNGDVPMTTGAWRIS